LNVDSLIRENDIEPMRPYLDSLLFGDLSPLADPRAHAVCFQVARAQQVFAQYLTLAENSAREQLAHREAELRQARSDALDAQRRIGDAERTAEEARRGSAALQKLQATTEAASAAGKAEAASLQQKLASTDEKLQEALRQAANAQDKASKAMEENRLLRQKLEDALERQERAVEDATRARAEARVAKAQAEREVREAREAWTAQQTQEATAQRLTEQQRPAGTQSGAGTSAGLGGPAGQQPQEQQQNPYFYATLASVKRANEALLAENARLKGVIRDLTPIIAQLPKCPACSRRFLNNTYLRSHIRKRHPEFEESAPKHSDRERQRQLAGRSGLEENDRRGHDDQSDWGDQSDRGNQSERSDQSDRRPYAVDEAVSTGRVTGERRQRSRSAEGEERAGGKAHGRSKTGRTVNRAIDRRHGGRYDVTSAPDSGGDRSRSSSASSRSSSASEVEIGVLEVMNQSPANQFGFTKIGDGMPASDGRAGRGKSNKQRKATETVAEPAKSTVAKTTDVGTSAMAPEPEPSADEESRPAQILSQIRRMTKKKTLEDKGTQQDEAPDQEDIYTIPRPATLRFPPTADPSFASPTSPTLQPDFAPDDEDRPADGGNLEVVPGAGSPLELRKEEDHSSLTSHGAVIDQDSVEPSFRPPDSFSYVAPEQVGSPGQGSGAQGAAAPVVTPIVPPAVNQTIQPLGVVSTTSVPLPAVVLPDSRTEVMQPEEQAALESLHGTGGATQASGSFASQGNQGTPLQSETGFSPSESLRSKERKRVMMELSISSGVLDGGDEDSSDEAEESEESEESETGTEH